MFAAFYSDPHFGHARVIDYCDRPFENVEHQTTELIRRYNQVIRPNDTVLWVGDCFLYLSKLEVRAIMDRLNGAKGIVLGNHDRGAAWMTSVGFAFAVERLTMNIAGRKAVVSHYPFAGTKRRGGKVGTRYPERRPKRERGAVLIHGHTHSARRRDGNMIHVGVDAWGYRPALIREVETLVGDVFRGPK